MFSSTDREVSVLQKQIAELKEENANYRERNRELTKQLAKEKVFIIKPLVDVQFTVKGYYSEMQYGSLVLIILDKDRIEIARCTNVEWYRVEEAK